MSRRPRFTPARRRALDVLVDGEARVRTVRVSNTTTDLGAERPTVYWQSARWLVAEGLAVDDGDRLVLADLARELAGVTGRAER